MGIYPRLGAGAMAGFEFGSGIFNNGKEPSADSPHAFNALLLAMLPEPTVDEHHGASSLAPPLNFLCFSQATSQRMTLMT